MKRRHPQIRRFLIEQNSRFYEDSHKDKSDRFVILHSTMYMQRLLAKFPMSDKVTLHMILWVLGQDAAMLEYRIMEQMTKREKRKFESEMKEHRSDPDEFGDLLSRVLKRSSQSMSQRYFSIIQDQLAERFKSLSYRGSSIPEKKLLFLANMFGLTEQELAFCRFTYIVSGWQQPETYFVDHLCCQAPHGNKYLKAILGMTDRTFCRVLEGTLARIDFCEMNKYTLELNESFAEYFRKDSSQWLSKNLFVPIARHAIPLEEHQIEPPQTAHVLKLLKAKGKEPVHILLYGKPGTGKTSYATGVANKLGIPAYEILREQENKASNRRAAILACLKTTSHNQGSLIVVDEADNLLNTECAWMRIGETQDKGWLNQLLEESGARMIWITNNVSEIEPSVMRRFAYSLYFKPFNRLQRIRLWDFILQSNSVRHFFDDSEVSGLAKTYDVSAGVIETAVKKSLIGCKPQAKEYKERIVMTLDAHEILHAEGRKPRNKEKIEERYSLDGLNIEGDLPTVMEQLEQFDRHLRGSSKDENKGFNLLFHGPPGTGKSELARYIAESLDRELIVKRLSDILSCWVGDTEQNIAKMFSEAEHREAVLVIDEADSVIFNRSRSVRSWEVSHTNEFLTQMERFRGILVCTTNRLSDLDDASIRRFNHKIAFGYLKPEGNITFYQKLLLPIVSAPFDDEVSKSLSLIRLLTPGDFRTVRDRFCFYPPEKVNHGLLLEALFEEARIKQKHMSGGKIVGF